MSDGTKIEWCDSTFNPWSGCTKVGPGCDNCYAEALSKRAPKTLGQWGSGAMRRRTSANYWRQPLRWDRACFIECRGCCWRGEDSQLTAGPAHCPVCDGHWFKPVRRRVFCASLADVFDNEVDPQWRADLFELIAATPDLDWLLLTKRIGNVERMIDDWLDVKSHGLTRWRDAPWPNVWLGATVVNQVEADRDIPKLLATPAAVRFLSIEPMLGPVDLNRVRDPNFRVTGSGLSGAGYQSRVDWVIAGGESGHGARPMHPDWARSLRDQCAAAGVAFLFKQWGEWLPGHHYTDEAHRRDPDLAQSRHECAQWDGDEWDLGYPMSDEVYDGDALYRVGKKAAGRLLDGVLHNAFPEISR